MQLFIREKQQKISLHCFWGRKTFVSTAQCSINRISAKTQILLLKKKIRLTQHLLNALKQMQIYLPIQIHT